MTKKKRQREFARLAVMLTDEDIVKLAKYMNQYAARDKRHRNAINQALLNATFSQIEDGANVLDSIVICDKPITEKYSNCPFALAGLAYTAGIARGKQIERDRKWSIAMKQAILNGEK